MRLRYICIPGFISSTAITEPLNILKEDSSSIASIIINQLLLQINLENYNLPGPLLAIEPNIKLKSLQLKLFLGPCNFSSSSRMVSSNLAFAETRDFACDCNCSITRFFCIY